VLLHVRTLEPSDRTAGATATALFFVFFFGD
jgi:hypothetical protein